MIMSRIVIVICLYIPRKTVIRKCGQQFHGNKKTTRQPTADTCVLCNFYLMLQPNVLRTRTPTELQVTAKLRKGKWLASFRCWNDSMSLLIYENGWCRYYILIRGSRISWHTIEFSRGHGPRPQTQKTTGVRQALATWKWYELLGNVTFTILGIIHRFAFI
jgi:hypothetical protein